MADEPNLTQSTETPPPPQALGNSTEARNPDGSLKEAAPLASQTPETTEKKPDTEAKTEPKTEAKTEAKTEPAAYKPFTAPEGYELNADLLAKATPIFQELGLSQDAAQKLVNLYGEAALSAEQAPYEAYETMRGDWRKAIIADPALGNGKDGLKPEVAATIGRAIDSLPPADAAAFREAMTLTGAGDNPAFIKAFHAIASRVGEGTLVIGKGPSAAGQTNSGTKPSPAQALFPNLPSSR
jgi:hypothetical protein